MNACVIIKNRNSLGVNHPIIPARPAALPWWDLGLTVEGFGILHKCPFSFSEKGASGSWATPYFACPMLRNGGFENPPGVLVCFLGAVEGKYGIPFKVQF